MGDYAITKFEYALSKDLCLEKVLPEEYRKYLPKLELFNTMLLHYLQNEKGIPTPMVTLEFDGKNEATVLIPTRTVYYVKPFEIIYNFEDDTITIGDTSGNMKGQYLAYHMGYTYSTFAHARYVNKMWLVEELLFTIQLQNAIHLMFGGKLWTEDQSAQWVNQYVEIIFWNYLAASSQRFELLSIFRDDTQIEMLYGSKDGSAYYRSIFNRNPTLLRIFNWFAEYEVENEAPYESTAAEINMMYPWHISMLQSEILNSINQFSVLVGSRK